MDLNRLFFLHQLSLIRAASTDDGREQVKHNREADGLARRIREVQSRNGADAPPLLSATNL